MSSSNGVLPISKRMFVEAAPFALKKPFSTADVFATEVAGVVVKVGRTAADTGETTLNDKINNRPKVSFLIIFIIKIIT